jgi:hypothetical protein
MPETSEPPIQSERGGKHYALGWAIGVLLVVIVFASVTAAVSFFYIMREASRVASCMNDIKMLHYAFAEYAAQHNGLLPPLSATRGNLTIDPATFYPDFLPNSCYLQCEWSDARRNGRPQDKNTDLGLSGFNDDSFVYIPWEIRSEAEAFAFVEAYKALDFSDRENDLVVMIDGQPHVLPRTRHILISDVQGDDLKPVPVFIEWPDHYHEDSVVVLSDGTAVRRAFSEPFPISDQFIAGLREIATLDGPPPLD